MDKNENFDEETAAEILDHPSTNPKEILENNSSSSPNTKDEDTRKRENCDESTSKNEEPTTKIPQTTTNFNSSASDENSDNECFINRLPEDLLSRIIELLPINVWPKMEATSRRFQAVTFTAWRNLRDVHFKLIDDKFSLSLTGNNREQGRRKLNLCLQNLKVRSPLISSISGFDKYVKNFDRWTIISAADFSHLRSVEFANLEFSPELFQLFFTTLKNANLLTDLRFINMNCYNLSVSDVANDKAMVQIFRDTALKLETFFFERTDFFRGHFLEVVSSTNLKKLSLAGSPLEDECVIEYLSKCTELRYLDISDTLDFGKPYLLTIASNCSKLETLVMSGGRFDINTDPQCQNMGQSELENIEKLFRMVKIIMTTRV